MTEDMFHTVLRRAGCEKKGDDVEVPEGRTMTLYLSHDGASLQVGRVVSLSVDGGLVEARDNKGESFLLSLDDLFAASISGGSSSGPSRKAGFLG